MASVHTYGRRQKRRFSSKFPELSFRVPAYRAACRLVRARMGHRQLALAAAACAYALASAARGAHAQLSQVEALVVSCDGVGSAPRCARAYRPGQVSCARQLCAGGNYCLRLAGVLTARLLRAAASFPAACPRFNSRST